MKRLLAAGLAWCLLQVQISGWGTNNTYYQNLSNNGEWVSVQVTTHSSADVGAKFSLGLGFADAYAANTGTFKPQSIQTTDYLSLIAMMGFTAAAVLLIRSCNIGLNSEVLLFLGGAAAFIAGEVIANIQYKKINTKTLEYNLDAELTDGQAEALRKLKQSYEDVKNTAETKRLLQIAAMVAFLAAGVVATVKYYAEKAAYKVCKVSYETAKEALVTCETSDCGACTKAEALKCKKVIPEVEVKEQEVYTCQVDIHCPIGPRMNIPPESVPFEPSKLQFTDFSKVGLTFSQNDSEKVFDSKTNEGQQAVGDDSKSVSSAAQANTTSFTTEIQTACIACKAQIVAVESGCTEHHKNAFAHAVACTPRKEFSEKAVSFINDGIKLAPSAKINPNFFERALELALPQAKAMDSQGFMLGMGAIGIGILVGVIVKQQWAIDKLIAYPGRRIALFGGAALLAGVTVFTTSNIVSKAKKNIEKIDKILKQFAESAAAAEAAGDVNPRKPRNVASLFVADVNLPGNQRFPCVVNGSNSTTCGSYAQVLAEALSEDEKDVEREGISLDPSVLTFGKQLGGGIDGLQGNNTLSGAAINNLAAGANQQAAITKESENVRNKLNDYLKEDGEEPIDFKAQDQKVADQLKQNTLDGLKESGTDIAAVFQDPGLEVASKLASDEVDHNPWSSFDFDTGSRKASRGLASANIRDLPALSLETDAQKKAKLQLNLPENSYISDKQGPSIWRVISKRYLQNFDRFFERITEGTTPVPMATAPVKEKKVKGKTKGKK